MPQVLEAPEIQAEPRRPIAIDDGYPSAIRHEVVMPAAQQPRQSKTLLRSVMSLFALPKHEPLPGCIVRPERHEAALDRICRIDPYLFIRALSG